MAGYEQTYKDTKTKSEEEYTNGLQNPIIESRERDSKR